MIEKVLKTIQQYKLIENGDKLVLAVSGGPDSIAMLDILNKLNPNEAKRILSESVKKYVDENNSIEKRINNKYDRNLTKLL